MKEKPKPEDYIVAMNEKDSYPTSNENRESPSWTEIGSSHKSLNNVVTEAIRKAILHGDFKPGDRLTEVRLAEMFNVSRNPIREALHVLQAEGIVEINPRKGARVPLLSFDEVTEIIELRAELEGMSAKYAADRCTEETRTELQALLEAGNKAYQQKDIAQLQVLNDKFHKLLAEAGKNRFLADFMQSLHERTQWLFSNTTDSRIADTWQEHAAIMEAVLSSDTELSSALAMRHVKDAGKLIIKEIGS